MAVIARMDVRDTIGSAFAVKLKFWSARRIRFMRSRSLAVALLIIFPLLFIACSLATSASAQETILHSFNGNDEQDGNEPVGGVVLDRSGNLYGTTFNGGILGDGTVYELSPESSSWKFTQLLSFNGWGGMWPSCNLVLDASGNLYGTTFFGGALSHGNAFEVSPSSGGSWSESGLHSFSSSGNDGTYPRSALLFDASGNAYGTTPGGGAHTWGTVYELSPVEGGGWIEKLLHSFNVTDGSEPFANVIFDAAGNLYGTTQNGGASTTCSGGCGVVFELSPKAGGGWGVKVLHSFNSIDGANPAGGVIFDPSGNLYGMTSVGGRYNYGVIFELSPTAGGGWKETILHNFNSNSIDGNAPVGSLVRDAAGNLYGATGYGGAYNYGTVFELAHTAHGWRERILHSFNSDGVDGYYPGSGGVTIDSSGNLYGTTENGGAYGTVFTGGTVYEITP
jgi:uncharacterized repeat protein (TIGR03803 family)